MKLRYYHGVPYVAPWRPAPAHFTRCGTCGRAWDDAKPTARTPAPGGRCPFEYMRGHGSKASAGESPKLATLPEDRPCAAPGLTSYRARGRYGWIMIGARDHAEALREARRSTDAPKDLQVWDGEKYTAIPGHGSKT